MFSAPDPGALCTQIGGEPFTAFKLLEAVRVSPYDGGRQPSAGSCPAIAIVSLVRSADIWRSMAGAAPRTT